MARDLTEMSNTCPNCGHVYTTSDGSDHRPEVCPGRTSPENYQPDDYDEPAEIDREDTY